MVFITICSRIFLLMGGYILLQDPVLLVQGMNPNRTLVDHAVVRLVRRSTTFPFSSGTFVVDHVSWLSIMNSIC